MHYPRPFTSTHGQVSMCNTFKTVFSWSPLLTKTCLSEETCVEAFKNRQYYRLVKTLSDDKLDVSI